MLITLSFKKSLIVEQFQGNYLKQYSVSVKELSHLLIDWFRLLVRP